MKRKTMQRNTNLTLKEASGKYLDNCVQCNLSEFSVLYYRESYSHFYTLGVDKLIVNGEFTAIPYFAWSFPDASFCQFI